ncbi:hypothetical protein SEA_ANNADREAMY_67 [Streptomyces phage Annadreamy]|uniref:Uncharacterized protein n=2 Tax=Annadreamyvirus annadreamy TaxID=2846392 RepID=A0A345GTB5_9CAUD|nr:hypothetical protein HWB75_gp179 [Streptomyces phage Annadreamy]AXG66187.1 hypothetical protein SEA_ANNADREAMY_67 [Streptomyces phage Annadreamy]QGH79399.1 hypothetical protein SEA_LIMPID_66 [Streptomyces phage Limpid]
MKYKSRQVDIDAIQFTGENWNEVEQFAGTHWIDIDVYMTNFLPAEEMWVDIPEGVVAIVWVTEDKLWAPVRVGDYIVKRSEDNVYPSRQSYFEEKYEPAEMKVEVNLQGGVVTAEQINRAVGHRIQQSRRFRG